jgi:hypothetical protein
MGEKAEKAQGLELKTPRPSTAPFGPLDLLPCAVVPGAYLFCVSCLAPFVLLSKS